MPIRIPDALPAAAQLESENIFVMTEYRALHQDIRPLRVLILNLMPTKIATETQIMRKLSNTPLQVEVDLLRTKTHEATHVSAGHLETFYRTFDDIRDIHYDGLIITGAPVEQMPFEEVDYWPELCQIMDWSTTHVHSTLHICWGAQAGLYHHYGIQKYDLPAKASGVLESVRMICVSVAILVGMRLRMSTRSGRMSWCSARYSVMTKMFSLSSCAAAGRASGIRMGMDAPYESVAAMVQRPAPSARAHRPAMPSTAQITPKVEIKACPKIYGTLA